jgi:Skp family chaperone for outer membrane proteins
MAKPTIQQKQVQTLDEKVVLVLKTFEESATTIAKEYAAIAKKGDSDLKKKIQKRTDKLDKLCEKGKALIAKLED